MITMTKDTMQIVREQDVVPFRNRVREMSTKIGMSLVKSGQSGVRLTFVDEGPGIENIPQAMQDGFSTGKSLGLGLPGAKRLVNEFDVKSVVGQGTTVTITHWKNGR